MFLLDLWVIQSQPLLFSGLMIDILSLSEQILLLIRSYFCLPFREMNDKANKSCF